MAQRTRVGLLFGGRSVEHEVSVVSARGVAAALGQAGLECVPLGVTGDGRWLTPELSAAILEGSGTRVEASPDRDVGARVLVDPGGAGLLLLSADGAATRRLSIDVLFPLVHGWGGEDGRLQGVLELAAIPYVGAGVLGSAVGMDKAIARQLFAQHGLPVAPWHSVTRRSFDRAPGAVEQEIVSRLGLPVFVKPANGGSSVGVSRASGEPELRAALDAAFRLDAKVVAEKALDAREIECAVLGNDDPEATGLGEIVPSGEFYDYASKYLDDASELLIPAELEPEMTERIREYALSAFRALDLRGFARVDFFVERETDQCYINEVNTLPGFTPISMFPKLWEAAGLSYRRLIERLVELALELAGQQDRRQTRRATRTEQAG